MQQKLYILCRPILQRELIHLLVFLSLIIAVIVSYYVLSPSNSSSLFNVDFLSQILPKNTIPRTQDCDYSYGKWVWDESQPLSRYDETCPFLDPGFKCHKNGRQDLNYQKWRWQPHECILPRFDANDFLERAKNTRIVFAGDSIGRNQWESLICMLAQGVSNISTVYEEHGSPITKHKGFLSIRFQQHNLTVQYYRVPYLVVIDRPPKNAPKHVRGVIRVDRLHWFSNRWIGADVLVFSAGHWWNQDKTVKSGHYFQEGNDVNVTMDAMEAFRRSLSTLNRWMVKNLEPERSRVFFRSYSPVHFRDGDWNKGGHCNTSKEPETDHTKLEPDPINNLIIREAVREMQRTIRAVRFVNVTYSTEFRKDGHPSSHREPGTPVNAPQDCSHWCLPGVPDTWNELLYFELLKTELRATKPFL